MHNNRLFGSLRDIVVIQLEFCGKLESTKELVRIILSLRLCYRLTSTGAATVPLPADQDERLAAALLLVLLVSPTIAAA